MAWYAAHAVLSVVFKDGNQDHIPIWENIYLVQADSSDAAFDAAEACARQFESVVDESFTWEGRSARWCFRGIRKMIACDVDENGNVSSGSEATFLQMELRGEQELHEFLNLETVTLKFDE
jgi:hypothetical protein